MLEMCFANHKGAGKVGEKVIGSVDSPSSEITLSLLQTRAFTYIHTHAYTHRGGGD